MMWAYDESQNPDIGGLVPNVKMSMPHIPVEIWSRIFGFAIPHIPGTLDIDDYSAIAAFTRDNHGICLSNRFKSSMQTKLFFSLVCKYWNGIAQPSLFQHLQITSGEHACVIANILDGIPRKNDDQEGPGKWTLRIDLALEGVHDWTPRHTLAMSRIFERCQNLLCFSVALSGDDPRAYSLSRIIRHLEHNTRLKRLEVRIDDEVLRAINDVLSDRLQVLWALRSSNFPVGTSDTKIFMPNLRALVATLDFPQYTTRLNLPDLRACILTRPMTGYPVISKNTVEYLLTPRVDDFSIWPNVTTLSISARELFGDKHARPEGTLRHAKIECIIIEDIDFKRWSIPSLNFGCFPSHLEKNLTTLLSSKHFPSLRCIKFLLPLMNGMHQPNWLPEEEKPIWRSWFQACNKRGVQIALSEGAVEWTEDYWTECCHERVLDKLFESSSIVEESHIHEDRTGDVEG